MRAIFEHTRIPVFELRATPIGLVEIDPDTGEEIVLGDEEEEDFLPELDAMAANWIRSNRKNNTATLPFEQQDAKPLEDLEDLLKEMKGDD